MCCHASSSQCCHVSRPVRKGRCANSVFGKGKWDENWPFTTSHKDIAVSVQHRLLSSVARSSRTTQHSQFLAHMTVSLTLLFDQTRKAERSMNGLKRRTGAPLPFNTLLRPSPTPGRNGIFLSMATHGCRRDTVLDGAVATGVPRPLMGDGSSRGTVESDCATRRCRTPPGTGSPDAVPQMHGCRSSLPSKACSAIPKD
jgi:hypothetical protein